MNQDHMTPSQALQLLDTVCSQVSGSRADHVRIQQAIQVLQAALQPEEDTSE